MDLDFEFGDFKNRKYGQKNVGKGGEAIANPNVKGSHGHQVKIYDLQKIHNMVVSKKKLWGFLRL